MIHILVLRNSKTHFFPREKERSMEACMQWLLAVPPIVSPLHIMVNCTQVVPQLWNACVTLLFSLKLFFLRRLITKPLLKSLGDAGIKVFFLKSSSIFRRKRPSRAKEVRSMGSNTIFCLIFCRLSLSLSYCIQEMFFSSILSYQFWWLTDNCPFSQGKLARNCRVTKIPLCCCGYCYSYFFCNQEQGFRTMSRCV